MTGTGPAPSLSSTRNPPDARIGFNVANSTAPTPPPPPCPDRLGCTWTQHGRKHFPHPGLTREHTKNGYPAKYLPETTPEQIQAIETATVRTPDEVLALPPGRAEYIRPMDRVIGWDRGKDAMISFAECSGGATAGRSYHGRPMAPDNHKLGDTGQ